jgi:hypothetical protein
MREQSDAGNRLEVVLGADVYREAMPKAYRIAAGFLFHMPTGVGYRIDDGEIARHSAVRRIMKPCVGKQKCALGYSIPMIDDINQRTKVESAFRKSPTAVF